MLFFNAPPIPEGSGFLFNQFLLFSLLPFLVSPALLFCVFYRLGRNVQLAERYGSVIVSLFAGGLVGTAPVYFLLPIALGSTWGAAFPDLLSVVTTAGGYLLAFVGYGLGALFPGFVAVTVANLRVRGGISNSGRHEDPPGDQTGTHQPV